MNRGIVDATREAGEPSAFGPDDLRQLGFLSGRTGINWTNGRLEVTLFRGGMIDVSIGDVPLYGVKTRTDIEELIRLMGEPA